MSKSHTTFFREEDVLSLNVKFTMQKELEVLIVVASKHVGATASGHCQQDLLDLPFFGEMSCQYTVCILWSAHNSSNH